MGYLTAKAKTIRSPNIAKVSIEISAKYTLINTDCDDQTQIYGLQSALSPSTSNSRKILGLKKT